MANENSEKLNRSWVSTFKHRNENFQKSYAKPISEYVEPFTIEEFTEKKKEIDKQKQRIYDMKEDMKEVIVGNKNQSKPLNKSISLDIGNEMPNDDIQLNLNLENNKNENVKEIDELMIKSPNINVDKEQPINNLNSNREEKSANNKDNIGNTLNDIEEDIIISQNSAKEFIQPDLNQLNLDDFDIIEEDIIATKEIEKSFTNPVLNNGQENINGKEESQGKDIKEKEKEIDLKINNDILIHPSDTNQVHSDDFDIIQEDIIATKEIEKSFTNPVLNNGQENINGKEESQGKDIKEKEKEIDLKINNDILIHPSGTNQIHSPANDFDNSDVIDDNASKRTSGNDNIPILNQDKMENNKQKIDDTFDNEITQRVDIELADKDLIVDDATSKNKLFLGQENNNSIENEASRSNFRLPYPAKDSLMESNNEQGVLNAANSGYDNFKQYDNKYLELDDKRENSGELKTKYGWKHDVLNDRNKHFPNKENRELNEQAGGNYLNQDSMSNNFGRNDPNYSLKQIDNNFQEIEKSNYGKNPNYRWNLDLVTSDQNKENLIGSRPYYDWNASENNSKYKRRNNDQDDSKKSTMPGNYGWSIGKEELNDKPKYGFKPNLNINAPPKPGWILDSFNEGNNNSSFKKNSIFTDTNKNKNVTFDTSFKKDLNQDSSKRNSRTLSKPEDQYNTHKRYNSSILNPGLLNITKSRYQDINSTIKPIQIKIPESILKFQKNSIKENIEFKYESDLDKNEMQLCNKCLKYHSKFDKNSEDYNSKDLMNIKPDLSIYTTTDFDRPSISDNAKSSSLYPFYSPISSSYKLSDNIVEHSKEISDSKMKQHSQIDEFSLRTAPEEHERRRSFLYSPKLLKKSIENNSNSEDESFRNKINNKDFQNSLNPGLEYKTYYIKEFKNVSECTDGNSIKPINKRFDDLDSINSRENLPKMKVYCRGKLIYDPKEHN